MTREVTATGTITDRAIVVYALMPAPFLRRFAPTRRPPGQPSMPAETRSGYPTRGGLARQGLCRLLGRPAPVSAAKPTPRIVPSVPKKTLPNASTSAAANVPAAQAVSSQSSTAQLLALMPVYRFAPCAWCAGWCLKNLP